MPADADGRALVRTVSDALGMGVGDGELAALSEVVEIIDQYRGAVNLSGVRARAELWEHVVEGLLAVAVARSVEARGAWLDVGSGGGFPGLVVATLRDEPVVLVEPRARRAAFLELAVASQGWSHATVRRIRVAGGRAEVLDGGPGLSGGFAVAGARAVFPPAQWLVESRPWLSADGVTLVHLPAESGLAAPAVASLRWGRWRVDAIRRPVDGGST